jgi:flagellar basal-body rod protein FlgC
MGDDLFASMAVSASGLSAQRKRMEAIAKNIANAETTRSADGGTYRRRTVVLSTDDSSPAVSRPIPAHRVSLARTSEAHLAGGRGIAPAAESSTPVVEAEEVVDEDAGYRLVYDPNHPDADEKGYVRLPDINSVGEMVDMITATRAYEANLSAMKAYQSMVTKSLEI